MKITLIILILFSFNAFSHGEGGDAKIGKGFAIEEYSEKKGFKLSEKALKRLKLKYVTSITDIPKDGKIKSLNGTDVYLLNNGFYRLVSLKGLVLGEDDKIVANKVLLLKNIENEASLSLKHHDHEDEHAHKMKKEMHSHRHKDEKEHSHEDRSEHKHE